jgi:hypothetical protein
MYASRVAAKSEAACTAALHDSDAAIVPRHNAITLHEVVIVVRINTSSLAGAPML